MKILPKKIDSAWTLRKDRIGYFRSYLVLNSIFYLSHQNILNLDYTTEVVTAPLKLLSSEGPTKRVQILFVQYESDGLAIKALERFHGVYLAEHEKGFHMDSVKHHMNLFEIEDGWVGYSIDGAYLAIVFDCPDRESAQRFLSKISSNAMIIGADIIKPNDIVGLVPTPFMNPTHTELIDVIKASLIKDAEFLKIKSLMPWEARDGQRNELH